MAACTCCSVFSRQPVSARTSLCCGTKYEITILSHIKSVKRTQLIIYELETRLQYVGYYDDMDCVYVITNQHGYIEVLKEYFTSVGEPSSFSHDIHNHTEYVRANAPCLYSVWGKIKGIRPTNDGEIRNEALYSLPVYSEAYINYSKCRCCTGTNPCEYKRDNPNCRTDFMAMLSDDLIQEITRVQNSTMYKRAIENIHYINTRTHTVSDHENMVVAVIDTYNAEQAEWQYEQASALFDKEEYALVCGVAPPAEVTLPEKAQRELHQLLIDSL